MLKIFSSSANNKVVELGKCRFKNHTRQQFRWRLNNYVLIKAWFEENWRLKAKKCEKMHQNMALFIMRYGTLHSIPQ
jgi:hypothetical protein